MIHHLSIAARDPKQAAAVLAELMGGTAVPFPPTREASSRYSLMSTGLAWRSIPREPSFSPAAPPVAPS